MGRRAGGRDNNFDLLRLTAALQVLTVHVIVDMGLVPVLGPETVSILE